MEKDYYTMKDVVRLTKYSMRQLERFLASGELVEVDHIPHHERKVSRASVDAFTEKKGIRPVDEITETKQATGEVARQLVALKARVEELEALIKRVAADLEAKLRAVGGQRSRGSAPADPDGAVMLVEFVEAHGTTMGIVRGLIKRDPTLATVIERPDAEKKKHKWMILPAQMPAMLAALEKRGIAYTRCPGCPHDDPDQAQRPQQEECDQVPLST